MQSSQTKEVEVFPGVTERRYFLRSSIASAAAMVALAASQNVFGQESMNTTAASGAELSWDSFLQESVPVAKQLFADPAFTVDEYLYRIGSLATRVREIPDTKLYPYTQVDSRVFFAPSFRDKASPFFIIQWRLEPGAVLPPHNHPNASVCTLGYQGQVRLRNFEIEGEAAPYSEKRSFRVRETHNEMMAPRRINTLSPTRDNIHCFQAGKEGARGIDISTLHGTTNDFRFLEIAAKPIEPDGHIFEATWSDIGKKKN